MMLNVDDTVINCSSLVGWLVGWLVGLILLIPFVVIAKYVQAI